MINRPNSIRILVILQFIVGGILVGGGGALLALEGITPMTLLLGGVHIILGLVAFPAAYLLWTGNGRAWMVALALNVVSILWSIGQEIGIMTTLSNTRVIVGSFYGTIIFILIGLGIIYTLTRYEVKRFYGKAPNTF